MNRHRRLTELLALVADRGQVRVEEIAAELGVSPATIRRDLVNLAQQQLLTRTSGGAVATGVAYDLPLRYKAVRAAEEKRRIANAAAALVAPGMVVGLNGGTTTTELARTLATREELVNADGQDRLTIVTNAVNIANELTIRPHVKIVVTGGVARTQSYELIGPLATNILHDLSLDVVFLGVNALHPTFGAATHDEAEASINRLMATRAKTVIVVADASKLGETAFARICAIDRIDVLITDSAAPEELVHQLRAAGVDVRTA